MVPSLDRDSGGGEPGRRSAPEDVLVRPRPLVGARVQLLGAQVGAARDERLEEGLVAGGRGEYLERQRAVEAQQVVARARVEAVRPGDPVEAGGAGEGAGPFREPAHAEVVERVERDATVGRQ